MSKYKNKDLDLFLQWVNLLEFLKSTSSGRQESPQFKCPFPFISRNVCAGGTASFVVRSPSPRECMFDPHPSPPPRSCAASHSHRSRLWMIYEENRPGHSARLRVHGCFCFCSSEVTGEAKPTHTHTHTHTSTMDSKRCFFKKINVALLPFSSFSMCRSQAKYLNRNKHAEINQPFHPSSQVPRHYLRKPVSTSLKWGGPFVPQLAVT